jgi:colanic acid biosynthesis glycosyl transferase WcaI
VLYSGAFALTYDFDLLLEAAKKLEDQNILFVLLGDGDAKSEILRKIENLRLDNVFLPTPVSRPEDVARFINYSDVCVIPLKPQMITSTLTRPSKVFEFWACGKPVVCCTKGELKDLIEQSGAGIVLEPGDLEAFTQAIKSLSSDPGRTSKMGEKAREFVLQRFSYERLKWKLGQMFDRLSSNTK